MSHRRTAVFALALTLAAGVPGVAWLASAAPTPADLGAFKVSNDKPQLEVSPK